MSPYCIHFSMKKTLFLSNPSVAFCNIWRRHLTHWAATPIKYLLIVFSQFLLIEILVIENSKKFYVRFRLFFDDLNLMSDFVFIYVLGSWGMGGGLLSLFIEFYQTFERFTGNSLVLRSQLLKKKTGNFAFARYFAFTLYFAFGIKLTKFVSFM